ncbi:MAG: multicopper oxidase domain-containing protein [Desulfobacterales bacterium]
MRSIRFNRKRTWVAGLAVALLLGFVVTAHARIPGITGTLASGVRTFNLAAGTEYIVTSDGDSFMMWLYQDLDVNPENPFGTPQYPGPTLIVNEGDTVAVNLTNNLSVTTSIVFPGHLAAATGGSAGPLAREAAPGSTVTYTFEATEPGTYLYRSGTRPDLQVEMGLTGAIIVRPAGFDPDNPTAYGHPESAYDREFLYLITEMDPTLHRRVELGQAVDTTTYFPTNWFINGRNFPDLMAENFVPWLPTQPYNCQPRMHPGEKVLIRLIGAGVDLHPLHLHGNDFDTIAVDGRLLESMPGQGPDLAWKATTIKTIPGQTADVVWTWTAEKLGWDIYGDQPHDCNDLDGDDFDDVTYEYCPDHGIPFPVILPNRDSMTFGQFYSGSPFLGGTGDLAPGDPGLNATAGYFYMWHSHTEKELTSNDIWPGGLVSFMIVEHPSVVIDPQNP